MIQVTTNDAGIERLVSSMKLSASCMSTQSAHSSVMGVDGSLTGYGGGLHRKRWLLAHEGAEFREGRGGRNLRI